MDACYEHREQDLLQRLLGMELGLAGGAEALTVSQLRAVWTRAGLDRGLVERLCDQTVGVEALEQLYAYAPRLQLATSAGSRSGLADLRELILMSAAERPVLVVDYLQKVRWPRSTPTSTSGSRASWRA